MSAPDELQLPNPERSIRNFGEVQLEDETRILGNFTTKRWNKVVEHEERMAELRQLIANRSVNVTEM